MEGARATFASTRMRYSIVLAVVALAACGTDNGSSGPPPGMDVVALEALPLPFQLTVEQASGRVAFDSACRGCHGVAGRGNGPAIEEDADRPPDLTAAAYADMNVAQLRERFLASPSASHDRLRTSLTDNEVREVLSYVTALSWPPDAPGSALSGREVYREYCVSCHGAAGDGNGPAAWLLVTRPVDFSSDTLVVRRDFEGLIRRTRDGPEGAHASSMPAWGLFFDDRMLWDVATYLVTFQTPASSRSRN